MTILKMLKSPISILQELASKDHVGAPLYEACGSGPDHMKSFECTCTFNGRTAMGKGLTKKDAKHDAANNMLKACGVQMDNNEALPNICLVPSKTKSAIPINYVGRLNEFCSGNRYCPAVYTENPIITNNQFGLICTFQEFSTNGYGSTKKDAKQEAAKNMLLLIKEKDIGPKSMVEDLKDTQHNDEGVKQALKVYTGLMANLSINENISTTTADIDVGVPEGTPEEEARDVKMVQEGKAELDKTVE
ncbi:unnamed protein product [Ceutorhynchus assimilis]|uniref:DRBM domain-containing protein n=1 Tax=Ceutorhynchus assimilis TaxID=467358 RepID=A0A9P0DCW0_9CUCU|nr:unnamed protein product [Ceutorhynchus assimilis]